MDREYHLREVLSQRPGQPTRIVHQPRNRVETRVKVKATGEEAWVETVDPDIHEEAIVYYVFAQAAKYDDYGNVLRPAIEAQGAPHRRQTPAYCREGEAPTLLKLNGSIIPWTRQEG